MATRFAGQGDKIFDSGVNKWLNVFGDVQVIPNLKRLKTKLQRNILRKAIAEGLKPVVKLAKQKAPKKTGLLRRAIKSKVTKMLSGKVFVDPAVFAIKNKATGGVYKVVKTKGDRKASYRKIIAEIVAQGGETQVDKPAKYAHIIEFGGVKRRIKAHPFMRPAMQESRSEILRRISSEVSRALKLEGAK